MPLILLEGLDGTGKSSIAEMISEDKGWKIVNLFENDDKHYLSQFDIQKETYHEDIYFLDVWEQIKFDCVKDRGFLSGIVYGEEDFVKQNLAYNHWLYKVKRNKDEFKIVYFEAKNKTITERDNEWIGREGELDKLRKKFEFTIDFLKRKGIDVKKVKTDGRALSDIFKEIKIWIDEKLKGGGN